MNPSKVNRARLVKLTDLPNIGPAGAADLELLGIHAPAELVGQNPFKLHERLCQVTGVRHDPCVIDVFMSITAFMNGEDARAWWEFTAERKRLLGKIK